MNKGGDNIADLLLEIVNSSGQKKEIYSLVGTVIEVNEDERTCDVRPSNDDADVLGVRLQASIPASAGLFIKPKVNSFVIVTFLNSNTGYVSTFTEIDGMFIETPETVFNEGKNGGLINIETLKEELNKTNAVINAMTVILNGAPIPEAGNGAPSSLQAALSAALSGLGVGNYGSMEDTKVKH